jgi:hypothetical protein
MDRLITFNGQPATTARQTYTNAAQPITLRFGPVEPKSKPQIAGVAQKN